MTAGWCATMARAGARSASALRCETPARMASAERLQEAPVQHILTLSRTGVVIVRHWFEIDLADATMEHGARIELSGAGSTSAPR